MSAIRKMNMELEVILGREPTIHEQIDILILSVVKNRVHELLLMLQVDPSPDVQEQYEHAMSSLQEIQDRNPEIFTFNDSDGGDYE